MPYTAPLKDMLFDLEHIAQLGELAQFSKFSEAGLETAQAVLGEAAKFNRDVFAPLNREGDCEPASWRNGLVTSSPGFKAAYEQFVHDGWQGLQHPTEYGGQGLPKVIASVVTEMQCSANLSFSLCPLLTDAAIEAIMTAGDDNLKKWFLDHLVSGEWTGSMNLTESQAGSDLALIRTKATKQEDGTYLLAGTKIFITWGEHDLTSNIIHLVLARMAGAPEGVKGLSLFVVPKNTIGARGQIEDRNDVKCISLEHKLGIKASPTCVMEYGDHDGAMAYILGEEGRGLEYMFIMMNAARFGVGIQGVAMCDRAYQKAVEYAKDRIQGRPVDGSLSSSGPIINHPDVRRMLMLMRAYTEGCRALYIAAAKEHDMAEAIEKDEDKAIHQAVYEFLVPLVKGYSTESSVQVSSLAVQVHGGMGFIEETGVAQYYRDSRILPIYEGTTAIQANDFVGRKTAKDGGKMAKELGKRIKACAALLQENGSEDAKVIAEGLQKSVAAYESVVDFVVANVRTQVNAVFSGSVPYLMLAGNLMAAWQLARSFLIAEKKLKEGSTDSAFLEAKKITARFYVEHILVQTPAMAQAILNGSSSVLSLPIDAF